MKNETTRHAEDVRGLAATVLLAWQIDQRRRLTIAEHEAHEGGLTSALQDAIDQYLDGLDRVIP